MFIRSESLVGFSSSVTLIKERNNNQGLDLFPFSTMSVKQKFVKVKGPGLVFLEMKSSTRSFF